MGHQVTDANPDALLLECLREERYRDAVDMLGGVGLAARERGEDGDGAAHGDLDDAILLGVGSCGLGVEEQSATGAVHDGSPPSGGKGVLSSSSAICLMMSTDKPERLHAYTAHATHARMVSSNGMRETPKNVAKVPASAADASVCTSNGIFTATPRASHRPRSLRLSSRTR